MFKRLLARLFGRKPKTAENKITVNAAPRSHDEIVRALATRSTSFPGGAKRTMFVSTPSWRREDQSLLNPLNPLSPLHADWDNSSHHTGHSWGGDSSSCDSGSSTSSGGSCD